MKKLTLVSRFKKDVRLAARRQLDLEKLDAIVRDLRRGRMPASRHSPHKLSGNYRGTWECHIEPDWLLVWYQDDEEIRLVRTGTHSDLFE